MSLKTKKSSNYTSGKLDLAHFDFSKLVQLFKTLLGHSAETTINQELVSLLRISNYSSEDATSDLILGAWAQSKLLYIVENVIPRVDLAQKWKHVVPVTATRSGTCSKMFHLDPGFLDPLGHRHDHVHSIVPYLEKCVPISKFLKRYVTELFAHTVCYCSLPFWLVPRRLRCRNCRNEHKFPWDAGSPDDSQFVWQHRWSPHPATKILL